MECATISSVLRGVPLALARHRLCQISQIARDSRASDVICRNWPNSRFDRIEQLAEALLESPPADLSAMAIHRPAGRRPRQAGLANGLSVLFRALRAGRVERCNLGEDVDRERWPR